MGAPVSSVRIDYPPWVASFVDWEARHHGDEERMRLAVALARENVLRDAGGPFGAVIFERDSGRLVSVGVNSVLRLNNSTLHAEMMAFAMAQARLGTYTLAAEGLPEHELFTSCEPCAMCLGGALWSGVCRLVFGALGEDVRRLGFEEGPVFPESHAYLEARGVGIVPGVCRDEAKEVLELYRQRGGEVYNGRCR
ncbi:MAG: nucleoside deaminase [Gemmatimonadaceae bacterium]